MQNTIRYGPNGFATVQSLTSHATYARIRNRFVVDPLLCKFNNASSPRDTLSGQNSRIKPYKCLFGMRQLV